MTDKKHTDHGTDEDAKQMCHDLEAHLKEQGLWCEDMESVMIVLREDGLHQLCRAHHWNMGQIFVYHLIMLQQHAGILEFGDPADEGPVALLRQMMFAPTAQAARDAVQEILHESPHSGAAFFGAVSALLSHALQTMVAARRKIAEDEEGDGSEGKKEDDPVEKKPKPDPVPEATGLEALDMMRKGVKAR